MDSLSLAELLCARVCHDLSGPVGAAAAGAELFEDLGGKVDEETVALVAASAAGAATRLKLLRAALGPAASTPQPAERLRDLVEDYLATLTTGPSFGLALDWRVEPPALGGAEARLLLNLLLLGRDALPRGGRLTVRADGAGLAVTAAGERALLGDEAREVLLEDKPPAGPRAAQALFARALAEGAGGLRVAVDSGGVTLSVAASAVGK
ncbi:histidine phosphotransferase family protein [Magnetospirillum sp. UT-4]|uniref:histidine phosphotransferase family protein n=1 Tax=Magnetospirillum sp. UT-4 TaxID=2681467 RepID=UPI00138303BD|nr:histidine phosphotransferase family protein [Magnetospirillum sp. UT-4]CAA7611801.1 conserved hypothetical protein [Magnetospirillum sp. UT-4]